MSRHREGTFSCFLLECHVQLRSRDVNIKTLADRRVIKENIPSGNPDVLTMGC